MRAAAVSPASETIWVTGEAEGKGGGGMGGAGGRGVEAGLASGLCESSSSEPRYSIFVGFR